MEIATITTWKPGTDLPYAISLGDDQILSIKLNAKWLKPDRSGQPLLLPPAIRIIDRLRAVFVSQVKLTPGFIMSLREAMKLTQSEFGQKIGVSKMTISRWECGKMKPGPSAVDAIHQLRKQLGHQGWQFDGEKRTRRQLASAHLHS